MATDYAGDPSNYVVTVPIPVDGVDAPTFVNLEAPVELNRDAIAYIIASLAQDWRPEIARSQIIAAGSSPVIDVISAAAWDPIGRFWLLGGCDNSGVDALFASPGVDDGEITNTATGQTWTYIGSTSISIVEQMAVLADESVAGRYWTAIAPNGGGVAVHSWLSGSSTSQHSFAPSGTLFPEMLFFNNRVIVAIGSATSASGSISSGCGVGARDVARQLDARGCGQNVALGNRQGVAGSRKRCDRDARLFVPDRYAELPGRAPTGSRGLRVRSRRPSSREAQQTPCSASPGLRFASSGFAS